VDLPTIAYFIVGFPGETETDIRNTMRFAKALTHDYGTLNMLFCANPLPGTPLHRQCETEGYLVTELNKQSLFGGIRLSEGPLIETKEFSKRRVFDWAREELDIPEIVSIGDTMPFFFANTPHARDRAGRLFPVERMKPYPWGEGYKGEARLPVKEERGEAVAPL
jgi:magnesium-protoporphyrin IX monomethyl ester (oxidative) cyclase